ncbi:MAG: hypothetical protein A3E81_02150 [Gammaproteobacteria bacterium RIFCSPHIGHO2_12_FULL_36_30]|nr:MAG: hypothetical protein A3E81_02150 [Gammaproteobacteria bacterium RIFCSPHIGHO2_12_FULL_36_30]
MPTELPFVIEHNGEYDLSHGFLPKKDPIKTLPEIFHAWEKCVHALPKLFLSDQLREHILSLPDFPIAELKTEAEFERAMMMLSYLGHAFVWHYANPVDHLPEKLSAPWVSIAKHIGRPPVLSYASYALYNWYRLDAQKPIELGNIALLQNFLGGEDEEWFILIHVDIEAKAIPAMQAISPAIQAAKNKNFASLIQHLKIISESLKNMCDTLDRMPERCDPYIYFNRVRPYIHGWKDNPALPNGLIYDNEFNNQPQFLKGETGAQSSIIPCLDALLGIEHAENKLKQHLIEMQNYMPPQHRAFLISLQKNNFVRDVVLENKHNDELKNLYNNCVALIARFRKTHVGFAAHYIQKQSQTTLANPTQVGTGGTPFMQYLNNHLQETETYMIR